MSFRIAYTLDNFLQKLRELRHAGFLATPELVEEMEKYIENLDLELQQQDASWQDFTAFWPPRCVDALQRQQAIVFFGAGLSLACGLPAWHKLLSENFGLDKALAEDKDLEHDPLTLAELASQYIGSEVLQSILRQIMNEPRNISVGHVALAALRCPFYITTNYDCLFEKAWRLVNPSELIVVTNDAGLLTKEYTEADSKGNSVLFKIHGTADRQDEYMILTRRDYRFHYRVNDKLFEVIRKLLRERHTIFVGFSHRDPEVSRLVEDAVYDYEKSKPNKAMADPRPQFYSLQFGMSAHAPEVFAARGIVALSPPAVTTSIEHVKTKALGVALSDLIGAKQYDLHSKVALDQELRDAMEEISKEIADALNALDKFSKEAENTLTTATTINPWLDKLRDELGELASQGVYLLDDLGNTVDYTVPTGLDKASRKPTRPLNRRPYFQQAKSFREPFLSDSDGSIFTGQSTFFLCMPVLKNEQSIGLLFAAAQIGQWKTPYEKAKALWSRNRAFLLIDSNGVCLLPPRGEFPLAPPEKAFPNESPDANVGYMYSKLLELSRRDALIRHISKSIVPVTQDDDVLELSRDLSEFSVVSELQQTRWKIAVSLPTIHLKA
jgi:hypothetical protein